MTAHPRPRFLPEARPAVVLLPGLAGFVLPLLVATGCRSSSELWKPERVDDMREAGSVHLSVLSVAPWSEYVAALQPNFSLTADAALSHVISDSRTMIQDSGRTFQAGTDPIALDRVSGGAQLRHVESADGPQAIGPGFPQGYYERLANRLPMGNGTAEAPPATGGDAMLKYTAATALYQEVHLLNRYIRDAAIPDGFRPYMVRLQVTLMPSRRHAPYDAYTTISFFIPGQRTQPPETPEAKDPAAVEIRAARSTSDDIFRSPFGNGPKILPLLVTDNLEASVQSRSFEKLFSLAAALLKYPAGDLILPPASAGPTTISTPVIESSDVVKQMYGGLIGAALRDEVRGRDLNSLLTVARLSENTLRIRLGAMQETTANYAMVPRNHNITLLLMVPVGAPPLMEVVSKTVLVDTETSEALEGSDERGVAGLARRLPREWGLRDLEGGTLQLLLDLSRRNDQAGFSALLRKSLPPDHPVLEKERSLWIELVSFDVGSQHNSHLFELPGQGERGAEASEIFHGQMVVLEDGATLARLLLREVEIPPTEKVVAFLTGTKEEGEVILPASSIEADASRRELLLTFPSLSRWRLGGGDPATLALRLRLRWGEKEVAFPVHYVPVEPNP